MGNPSKLRARVVRQGTEIIAERDEAYGAAWKTTGEILAFLLAKPSQNPALFQTPYGFNWIMILNKLNRALASPENPDHWLDIAGYATLVYEEVKDAAEEELPSQ
jgi:hypothetical protein